MGPRKTILRLLLASLAVAAVAGVFAVLLPARDMMLRVMATGFATAVAAGLSLPVSMMIDRERTRPAGLFGLALIVAEFILWLVMLWVVDFVTNQRLDDQVIVTIWTALCVGIGTMICLLLVRSKTARIAGLVGLAGAAATMLAFLVAIWLPRQWGSDDDWWATGATVAGCGLLALLALVGLEVHPRRHWRWLGIAAAGASAGLILMDIWGGWSEHPKVLCPLLSVAILVAYAVVLWMLPLKGRQGWVRWGTIGTALLTAAFINVIVILEPFLEDLFERLTAAGGIVTACGTLSLLVLAAFNRRVEVGRTTSVLMELTVVCPRCRRKQTVPVGDSACKSCGLRIHLRIEEPRCPHCDYLLHALTSDRCPECGATIAGASDAGAG